MARTKKTPVVEPTIDKEKEELQKQVKRYEDLLVRASHHVEKLEYQIEDLEEKVQELKDHNKISMREVCEKVAHNDFLIGRWMKDSMRKKYGKR